MLQKFVRTPLLRGFLSPHFKQVLVPGIPIRFFALEQRGYREPYDFDYITSIYTYLDVDGSFNTEDIVYVFRKREETMTDKHMAILMKRMADYDLDRSKEFYDEVLPIVIEQIKYLDRQCTQSLHDFAYAFGKMQIHDNRLWSILQEKMLGERLWRYFKIQDLGSIVEQWVHAGRASPEFLDIYQKRLYKHRRALLEEDIERARRVLTSTGRASEEFMHALENPTVELPALE